jgi:hypothetical protein
MTIRAPRTSLVRRIASALDATPTPRIPVLLGGCGTGRTFLLDQLSGGPGERASQYINVERSATTPERFLGAVLTSSPCSGGDIGRVHPTPRAAFDATLAFLTSARGPGGEPVTFLLDEFLELRTFESFPGLRGLLPELLQTLADSRNRFVLATRYVARAHRFLRDASPRFEVIQVSPLTAAEVADVLAGSGADQSADLPDLARAVHALADGRPFYVQAIIDELVTMQEHGGGDPVSALAALLAPDGQLTRRCCFCYELRLHRARGYGALKAILDILADEEPLTLTEISQRMQRTPGSTKDYLSWLEDVDLVAPRQKRYSFTDPLLRLWVRLHCRPTPPGDDDLAREVQRYAHVRLPAAPEPAMAVAGDAARESEPDDRTGKSWGIIEID